MTTFPLNLHKPFTCAILFYILIRHFSHKQLILETKRVKNGSEKIGRACVTRKRAVSSGYRLFSPRYCISRNSENLLQLYVNRWKPPFSTKRQTKPFFPTKSRTVAIFNEHKLYVLHETIHFQWVRRRNWSENNLFQPQIPKEACKLVLQIRKHVYLTRCPVNWTLVITGIQFLSSLLDTRV